MENKLQTRRTLIRTDDYHLEYEMLNEAPFLHMVAYKWSLSKYKAYCTIWKSVLDVLNKKGYDKVYCITVKGDKKTIKFQRMFGFDKLTDLEDSVLMFRSTTWV